MVGKCQLDFAVFRGWEDSKEVYEWNEGREGVRDTSTAARISFDSRREREMDIQMCRHHRRRPRLLSSYCSRAPLFPSFRACSW